jgi:H+/Cl- antiporter ClcA
VTEPAPTSPAWRPRLHTVLAYVRRRAWDDHGRSLRFLLRWLVLGSVVGVLAGSSSAVFLYGLQLVTSARTDAPTLLFALPLGGFAIGLLYHLVGGRSAAGNNLILDEIHGLAADRPAPPEGARFVPRRLAPLVLVGTWVTHLFGGSAGREGTAIQMSGSLSDGFARLARLRGDDRRLLLIAAVSGGFASVFSVPLAGAVFGLEVQSTGRLRYDAIVPALTAAVTGNLVFHAIDLPHDVTPSYELAAVALTLPTLGKVALAAIVFGLVATVFTEVVEGLKDVFARAVRWPPLRPALGGLVVVAAATLLGTDDYLGLSLPLIDTALTGGDLVWFAFALKLLFTAVTLGAGFQGGEVTPLFVIGATLGAALAGPLGMEPALLGSIGFVAVFAAATNTPLACTIMGLELFGPEALPYLAVGCVIAFVASGHRGIYGSQRVGVSAGGADPSLAGRTLTELRDERRRRG